jgi:hypothetical protein
MRTVVRYVSGLLGAMGTIAMVLSILSSVPGAFANEPISSSGCDCPGSGDCYTRVVAYCLGDPCYCCFCDSAHGCSWDSACIPTTDA